MFSFSRYEIMKWPTVTESRIRTLHEHSALNGQRPHQTIPGPVIDPYRHTMWQRTKAVKYTASDTQLLLVLNVCPPPSNHVLSSHWTLSPKFLSPEQALPLYKLTCSRHSSLYSPYTSRSVCYLQLGVPGWSSGLG